LHLNRLLKYVNVLIGIAFLACLGGVAWFGWRVLPKTSGNLEAPISQRATVTRDSLGVAHIEAASVEDALFLQGYVTAQDRMWQMDAIRRAATGELSEIIGPATLELDREARRLRTRRLAEEHTRRLSANERTWLAAYARGVNYYIETHRHKLPAEFTLLDYDPRPWTIADTLAVGLQMYRDLTNSWKGEIAKMTMLAEGDAELISQLYAMRTGLDLQPGSNAWAVAGSRSTTGKPLLANDTHLEFGMPSTWYMIHLRAPDLNVAGFTLPGVPAVIVGHNERIAWGVTNLHYDVQDLYIEGLNPQTGVYLFEGQRRQARQERELIPVKGRRPVEFQNWVTHHGPVWTSLGGRFLTLQWSAAVPEGFGFPFVRLNRARNWTEFRAALRDFKGPGQNFVYADIDGNIAYQATGALPVRLGFDGSVPVDGTSGQFEWHGFIPFDELPSAFNPSDGIIVSANQNPFLQNWQHPVNGDFAPPYRARQIRARLLGRSKWTPEGMLALQKDVYSPLLHSIARQAVRAVGTKVPNAEGASEALAALQGWNGQAEKDLAAPFIAELIYQQLRTEFARRASPKKPDALEARMSSVVIDQLLRERPADWFKDYDAVLRKAFIDAIEEGRRRQGRNPAAWKWGVSQLVNLKHPVGSQVPLIGRYFNVGEVPMSGCATCVKQTSSRMGPSQRFVAAPGDWGQSLGNVTIGQSGHFLSSHYKDQWDAYYVGRSFPMKWQNFGGDTLTVEPPGR
jgi:penicillin amidase